MIEVIGLILVVILCLFVGALILAGLFVVGAAIMAVMSIPLLAIQALIGK